MSGQPSPLARRDNTTTAKDAVPTTRRAFISSFSGSDPILLTITGVLVFVMLVLVIVFRTLYPGAA